MYFRAPGPTRTSTAFVLVLTVVSLILVVIAEVVAASPG
jgi:hypothetical protein